jgi:DNA-binding NtrC family response regulator
MLLDLGLPGGSGFDVLTALADRPRPPTIVVVTARDDMQSTVKAIQLGAYEYLVKPVDIDRLKDVVKSALASRTTRDNIDELVSVAAEAQQTGAILGKSPKIREVWKHIGAVSTTRAPVLIVGESGTGKELVARAIHMASADRERPFMAVNCTALAPGVLESELFGHVKGAFTGAVANKQGKFQAADGGTLFLDEIGEMPIELQVKLLRAIQEKVVFRVGDTRPETVDIRILAATNRELEKEIAGGRFREDLYYRLNVVNVELPPLRARGDDVLVIARYLMSRYSREYDAKVKGFSPNATVAIRKHNWPGNIRELENRIKKAIVLCESTVIGPDDLGLTGDSLPQILTLAEAKDKFQRDYINEVLALNNGNRTKTARDLGVDPRTVFRHLEKEGEPGDNPDGPQS